MSEAQAESDMASLLSNWSVMPEPDTCTRLVKRYRAMIFKLLPIQVDLALITEPTSSIITASVCVAFAEAAGSFTNVSPFCLLTARSSFIRDAKLQPTDFDENMSRAVACEMIARQIIHTLPQEQLQSVMSTRFRYKEIDGDDSPPTSALETAIDQNAKEFLSSSEAQFVVNSLWNGDWVQQNNDDDDIDYHPYDMPRRRTIYEHFNPQRLGTPRYQNIFRTTVWIIFLFIYSQAVASPLDRMNNRDFDGWEYALYIFAASQMLEELLKLGKTIMLSTNFTQAFGFWQIINLSTDSLLLTAFAYRIKGILEAEEEASASLRLISFQFLACVSPFIWIKLVTIFDGWKTVGSLQIVVFRMLRESVIFFILLAVMALGFVQSLVALDAADSSLDSFWTIINLLVQALLGSPDFATITEGFGHPFGLIIYYGWAFLTILILLNILIALFGTAYSDIYEDATNQYLAFFAYKTVSMIRAPDSYVYPSPFNLLEFFFVAPLEFILSKRQYRTLNRWIMSVLFFFPLVAIAVYEAAIAPSKRFKEMFPDNDVEVDEQGNPTIEDPEVDERDGLKICTKSFAELTKSFPDTTLGGQASLVHEIDKLAGMLQKMEKKVDALARVQEKGNDESTNKEGK